MGSLQITSSTIAYNSAFNSRQINLLHSVVGFFSSGSTSTGSSIIALNTAPAGPDFLSFFPENGLQRWATTHCNDADAIIFSQPTDQVGH